MRYLSQLLVALCCAALVACGGGAGDNVPGGAEAQQALDELDARYPAPTSGMLNIVYQCGRANSSLTYYLYLRPDGVLDWQFTTDAHQTFRFNGLYSFANGAVQLEITDPGFPLNENLSVTSSHLGLLTTLESLSMGCVSIGHGYDEQIDVGIRHYQCPTVSQGAGSDVENAIELGADGLGGSIFRQRDTYPTGSIDPIIRRGYGIYRLDGNRVYAFFGNNFDDYSVLTGTLENGALRLRMDQMGNAGVCDLR